MSHDSQISNGALVHWFWSALSIAAMQRHPILMIGRLYDKNYKNHLKSACLSENPNAVARVLDGHRFFGNRV